MKLWDLSADSLLYSFDNHTEMIWAVGFSPDEHYVASASWDGTINVWDIQSKRLICKFKPSKNQ